MYFQLSWELEERSLMNDIPDAIHYERLQRHSGGARVEAYLAEFNHRPIVPINSCILTIGTAA